jgi:adenylate kinase
LTTRQQPFLFDFQPHRGRRIVVTGQVGVDKKPFLEQIAAHAEKNGRQVTVCHIGDMMYAEAPDVVPGRILDLPIGRLSSLRRAVFKDVLRIAEKADHLVVNTHATFRWRHGLFPSFDHDQLAQLNPDCYITIVDDVDAVHERLMRDHDLEHTLKDVLVWREEEILATEVLATITRGHGCFYIVPRAESEAALDTVYRLMFQPDSRRAYLSFPMTHVVDQPVVQAELEAFRSVMSELFVAFDPAHLDEKRLVGLASKAKDAGQREFEVAVSGRPVVLDVQEVLGVAGDIDGQIYARDFKLIDQADMIVSYIPEMPDGRAGLSSGVERELQHAFESTKEVYVIWRAAAEPSPFVTKTATRIFRNLQSGLTFFQKRGYIGDFEMPLSSAVTHAGSTPD